ncbi:SRPBCC family protein [Streptomyces sp. AS02]|uniref:SRPBCC family protein n=1 Tax=Streptomyces sp. AS02 TaxID=2938946 RepID=UPI002020D520|nr:SRPBCC family protein [Streptomyces sp. AS02]MCL8012589.1 SRPBCC family protein [Streptomyces sp. AS02]
MDWSHYRFRSLWALPAPAAAVYDLLEQAEDYPRWWPQVREVTKLSDTTGVITIRSVLPYDMVFTAREVLRDREGGVLEIAMSGDIEGWARWTVTPRGGGSLARYDQVVDVNKPLLRRFAVPGRPVFRANHWLMMRAGRRGLMAYLAGGRRSGPRAD